MDKSILFVGGGNMASALIAGALQAGWDPGRLHVVEPLASQREFLKNSLGAVAYAELSEYVGEPQVVIWALKPQLLQGVIEAAGTRLRAALHLSIAAGVGLSSLVSWLGTGRVIRAMPNTPAMVSSGVTGLCAGPGLVAGDAQLAEKFFAGAGVSFWVTDDDRMDAVTALTGSGPAYVFHFLEGLQNAAVALGFDASQARELTLRVAQGAVTQALQTGDEVWELRERVTSKGGTTAAAISVLDERKSQQATVDAVRAAFLRARELGSQS